MIRDRIPSLITVALLFILVLGTWWSAHYTMSTIEIDPPRKLTDDPDAWAYGFIMLRTNPQGQAINRLEGDYFEHYPIDRKSTRLNSSHVAISYAVFCLKKKKSQQ